MRATSVEPLGELWLPSGNVIVSDPAQAGDENQPPCAEQVPSGHHPVSVSKITVQDPKHPDLAPYEEGVAAARLLVRDTSTVAREPAMLRGEEEFHGYGVDSGRACCRT